MRKILGNFGTIARPFLRAIILLPLFIPAMCHAQWSCPTWPTISSVTPSTWVAGQTYNKVVITGTGFKGPTESCNEFFFRVALTNGGNVTLSDVSTVSDTKMTATVTLPPSDTAQTACVTVEYQWWDVIRKTASGNSGACPQFPNGNGTVVPFAVPILCSVPSVNSITPDGWWATGQPQDITIAGSCFLKSSDRGGPSKVKVTDAAGVVKLSNINVVSATQITASVKVSKDAPADPAETATLTVTNPSSGGTPQTATANPAPVVLPVPEIDWLRNRISGDHPQTRNPHVQIGQPVELKTKPATLPGGFTVTGSNWTIPGTNVQTFSHPNNGIVLTPTKTDQPNTTFYWLYPKDAMSVVYTYCAKDPNGNEICESPEAKAVFSATSPGSLTLATEDSQLALVRKLDQCVANAPDRFLEYGDLSGPAPGCGDAEGHPGIHLTASGASSGTYKFAQIVNADVDEYTHSIAPSPTFCGVHAGLDGSFPYKAVDKNNPQIAYDGPQMPLPGNAQSGTRTFHASMYLLWLPDPLPGTGTPSIPVPIGRQDWQFIATAVRNAKGKWERNGILTASGNEGGSFLPSTPYDNAIYGYPQWTHLSSTNCGVSQEAQ